MYEYLIVGAGLFGACFAFEALKRGKSVLILDRRSHIGGNVYTEHSNGICVHTYGAHIFHTNNKEIWEYVNHFAHFDAYVHSPKANFKGKMYSLPFSMNMFSEMWGVSTPDEAQAILNTQRRQKNEIPRNLEEQAISMVGTDIYERIICGYTEKQWGRPCCELPPFILTRLPLRFTYDNNYFSAKYQGLPLEGYTPMIQNMVKSADVICGQDYLLDAAFWRKQARRIIFTGPIDEYFSYKHGTLEYRSLRFETEYLDIEDYQGTAVVNYTDAQTPWTRIIEYKHLGNQSAQGTIISREYSIPWKKNTEPYYPVNDVKNNALYELYKKEALKERDVYFGGRLGEYKYYDMDATVESALRLANTLLV